MDIRPTQPGQTPQTGPGSLKETTGNVPVRPDERPAAQPEDAPRDSVQLSAAVRELRGRLGLEEIPGGQMPPERLKEVLARIAQGHYDRPEVLDELTRQLAAELGTSKSGE